MKASRFTTLVNVRIHNEVVDYLKKTANKRGRTISGIINEILLAKKNETTK